MAPAYDVVSVVQYPEVAHELAMAFADEFVIDSVRPYDFAKFAQDTNTPRLLLAREMRRMAKMAGHAGGALADSDVYREAERPLVKKIAAFVAGQAQRLAGMAGAMLEVDDDLL